MPTSNLETGDHPSVVETPVHPFASLGWRTILLVLALTFLALGLRLYHLSSQSMWIDEIYSVFTAKVPMNQIYYYSTRLSNSLPTYFLLLKIALGNNTDIEYNARLLSALAGGLSVPVFIGVVYCWRRHIDTALLAGLLLAPSLHGEEWTDLPTDRGETAPPSLPVLVGPDAPELLYVGRFDKTDPKIPLCQWPASSVRIKFRGTAIQVRLALASNRVLVSVDGKLVKMLFFNAAIFTQI